MAGGVVGQRRHLGEWVTGRPTRLGRRRARGGAPVAVDVNGEFQQAVEGLDPNRDPPNNDDLETAPAAGTDDLSRYGRSTPASTDDARHRPRRATRRTPPWVSIYPVQFGYDDALEGADDWTRIKFRIEVRRRMR